LKLETKIGGLLDAASADDLEPLWIAGLALLCVLLGSLLWGSRLGLGGEGYEWAIYLTLGIIFPALLLIVSLPKRFSQVAPNALQMFKLALALMCILVSVPFIIRQHQYTALAISIAHLLLLMALNKRVDLPLNPVSILVSFFVIVLSWTVSSRLLWWDSFGAWFFSGSSTTETVYRFSLQELLNSAGVKADDPIVYSAVRVKAIEPLADGLSHDHGVLLPAWPINNGQQLMSTYRAWLPTTPFVLFASLSEERRQTYMSRFTARTRLSGWLIQNRKEASYTSSVWFHDQIARTHTPTKVFENN